MIFQAFTVLKIQNVTTHYYKKHSQNILIKAQLSLEIKYHLPILLRLNLLVNECKKEISNDTSYALPFVFFLSSFFIHVIGTV